MEYPELKIPCPNGVTASTFRDIIIDLSVEGVITRRQGEELIATSDPGYANPVLEWSTLSQILAAGGSFKNIRMGVKILQSSFGNDVPDGVPGATYIDESEVTQRRTWSEWVQDGGQTSKLKDGNVDGILKTAWTGKLLDSSELQIMHGEVGVTVYDWSDFIIDWNSPDYDPEV